MKMRTETIEAGPGWYAASQEGSHDEAVVVSRWVAGPEASRHEADEAAKSMGLGTPVLVKEYELLITGGPVVCERGLYPDDAAAWGRIKELLALRGEDLGTTVDERGSRSNFKSLVSIRRI